MWLLARVFVVTVFLGAFALSHLSTATDPSYLVGPLSIANGAVLGFGATQGGADVRFGGYEAFCPVSGWGVTSTNKVLKLSNPGAYDVTASIFITGNT